MKKFISLFISLTLALGLFVPCVSASATPTLLTYEDFESVNASDINTYLHGTGGTNNNWAYAYTNHTTSDAHRAQITLGDDGSNKYLDIAGIREKYKNANMTSGFLLDSKYGASASETDIVGDITAIQSLENKFDLVYSASSFSNSKLVVSFDFTAENQIAYTKSPLYIGLMSQANTQATLDNVDNEFHITLTNPVKANLATENPKWWVNYNTTTQEITGDAANVLQTVSEEGGSDEMKITIVVDADTSTQQVYVNGILAATTSYAVTQVAKLALVTYGSVDLTYDNIRAVVVSDTFDMEDSALAGQTAVAVDAETVFAFNNEIDEASLSTMTITANGSALTAGTDYTAALAKDTDTGLNTKVKVTFPNNMAYGTDYVITFPTTFKDAAYTALAAPETVSFTTKSLPTFTLSDIAVNSGWGGAGAAVTSLSQIAGGMAKFSVTATSTTATEVPGVVVIALYKDGSIVSFGASDKNFATGASDTVSCAMYIPEDTTGYTVKAFVCGGLNDLTAFGEKTFN